MDNDDFDIFDFDDFDIDISAEDLEAAAYQDTDEIERMRNKGLRKKNSKRRRAGSKKSPQKSIRRRSSKSPSSAKKQKRKKKYKLIIVELLVLIVLLFTAYRFIKAKSESGYWNIAVFGVDSRDGNLKKGALSDVEMICSINKETGEIKLISVYRDTYLKIDSDGTCHKINEAYAKGGPEQALYALNENLDLNIKDYATFNWKAVADAINILGGIDLEITDKEFKYINGFITETVESTGIGSNHLKSPGMNHLDGVQAVAYSRLRLMDTDFNRTERQRKVVSLAMEKAKAADLSVLNNILVTVLPQVATNVGVDDLLPMAINADKYYLGETAGFPFAKGTTKIGKMDCVIPQTLESNVTQLHAFLFGDDEFTPSSTVEKISAKVAEESGMSEVGKSSGADSSSSGGSSSNTPQTNTAPQTEPDIPDAESEAETEETEEETIEDGLINIIETNSEAETEIGPGVETSAQESEKSENDEPVETETAADNETDNDDAISDGPGV